MKEINLQVTGIMCQNCVAKISTAISEAAGCGGAEVSTDFSTVSVRFDENQINAAQIAGIIEGIKGKSFQVTRMEEC